MSELKIALLPCPFCGGEAQVINYVGGGDNNKVNVVCNRCGAESKRLLPPWNGESDDMDIYKRTQTRAIEMWNRRDA